MAGENRAAKGSAAKIAEQVSEIQKVVEKINGEHTHQHFTSVTPEDIENKLKSVHSPMIISQSWGNTTPGGTIAYSVSLYNPDTTSSNNLFVHVWIGSGNVDPTVGTFLLNVDSRFPRLTEPPFSGLTLAAGASATLNYTIKVPDSVEQTKYIGNSCLMQFNWHDQGMYLDRGVFVFTVS